MNAGRFTRERSLGNQHAKGNPPNRTSFAKGSSHGELSKSWKGGLQKCDDGYYVWTEAHKRMRRGRYNWENEYGKISTGLIIYHIDGDCYNDDLENLELITRAELLKRNN
jgi:hypothetical protein